MLRIFGIVLSVIAMISGMVLEMSHQVSDISASTEEDNITDVAHTYADEYMKYLDAGIESDELKDLTAKYRQTEDMEFNSRHIHALDVVQQYITCTTCRIVAEIAKRVVQLNLHPAKTEFIARNAFHFACQNFNLQTAEVCSGLFALNWPILYYILTHSKADAQTFCGILPISFCQVTQPEFNWSIEVDAGKGPLTSSKPRSSEGNGMEAVIILHLTDIHYDPEYAENTAADCREPLCCRTSSTPKGTSSGNNQSGYWSDYRDCDAPLYMIENALDHIRKQHRTIDYIYVTGDIVPHNVWSTTRDANVAIITATYQLIKEKFGDTKIYPVMGNHEVHPVNILGDKYLPDKFQPGWLYEHLWAAWQHWLPSDTKDTILEGGYYTVTPRRGFRIIALNNNHSYRLNWWLYYDGNIHTSLPQLQWLHDTLLRAEEADEYVHILAHIPSGGWDCWHVWAREFNRIIERFSDTIGGIFNGHTHYDEMQVHYSQNHHAMMVSWNGGSLTPHTFHNPNYRLYTVEPLKYQVTDHSTWIFNITEANEYGSARYPNWFEEYAFSEFTNDLSPSGIDALLHKITVQPDILRQYWKYKVTSADPQLAKGCDDNCLLETICSLATSVYTESRQCEELKAKLKHSLVKLNAFKHGGCNQ